MNIPWKIKVNINFQVFFQKWKSWRPLEGLHGAFLYRARDFFLPVILATSPSHFCGRVPSSSSSTRQRAGSKTRLDPCNQPPPADPRSTQLPKIIGGEFGQTRASRLLPFLYQKLTHYSGDHLRCCKPGKRGSKSAFTHECPAHGRGSEEGINSAANPQNGSHSR